MIRASRAPTPIAGMMLAGRRRATRVGADAAWEPLIC